MLTDYVIMPGVDYQDACDAIREKTGKTDAIVSGDMGEEIRGISGGGSDLAKQIVERTVTEIDDDTIESVGYYALNGASKLVSVRLPNATKLSTYALGNCSNLSEVYFPKVTAVGTSALYSCGMLESIKMHSLKRVAGYSFSNCTKLRIVDLPAAESIADYGLVNNSVLQTIILRNTKSVCAAESSHVLNGTPFASGGTGGRGFVPRDLIATYQEATNWSTLYAAGTCTFLALEDYTVDGTTTGEMDWDKVNALDEEVTA